GDRRARVAGRDARSTSVAGHTVRRVGSFPGPRAPRARRRDDVSARVAVASGPKARRTRHGVGPGVVRPGDARGARRGSARRVGGGRRTGATAWGRGTTSGQVGVWR